MILKAGKRDSLHRSKHTQISEAGQSTIEFLTTFIFAAGFIFLFVRLSLSYTNGYLVHYANYMASRTYLVFDDNLSNPIGTDAIAFNEAKKTFLSYRVGLFIPGIDDKISVNDPQTVGKKYYVGTVVNFTQRFPSPMLIGAGKEMNLVSESFLGREPSRFECLTQVCSAITSVIGSCETHATFFDNGC